jgi:methylated-DNA-[protein]-cysteine S-methyltransferase
VKERVARLGLPVAGWAVRIRADATHLLGIDFVPGHAHQTQVSDPLLARAIDQLQRYFEDPTSPFDLPLADLGTSFQRQVWRALRGLRAGATRTYGEFARQLETSPRAVGGACRANPFAIVVPCHRIVSLHGLGGFSGAVSGPELKIKQWLLDHEDKIARHQKRAAAA